MVTLEPDKSFDTALKAVAAACGELEGQPSGLSELTAWQQEDIIADTLHDGYHWPLAVSLAGSQLLDDAPERQAAGSLLTLQVVKHGGHFRWVYDSARTDKQYITRLTACLETLLAATSCQETQKLPVSDLPLLPPEEREWLLYTLNQTDAPYPSHLCVHQLFELQAEKNPEAIALVHKEETLSYGDLNRRANRLAHYLTDQGIQPDDRIALCAARGIPLITALLAILKAGAAYVPIDPAYPGERLRRILSDAAPRLVLTDAAGYSVLGEHSIPQLALEEADSLTADRPEDNPDPQACGLTPHHLAYIIYTSGSTGQPKGVMVEHRNVCNLAIALALAFKITSDSRVLQFFSVSFDACVSEVFVTLSHGASLFLFDTTVDGLADILQLQRITHVTLTPTVLATLPEDKVFPTLNTLIIAGEVCPAALCKRWATGRRFINAYGPTESTVCATQHVCSGEE